MFFRLLCRRKYIKTIANKLCGCMGGLETMAVWLGRCLTKVTKQSYKTGSVPNLFFYSQTGRQLIKLVCLRIKSSEKRK